MANIISSENEVQNYYNHPLRRNDESQLDINIGDTIRRRYEVGSFIVGDQTSVNVNGIPYEHLSVFTPYVQFKLVMTLYVPGELDFNLKLIRREYETVERHTISYHNYGSLQYHVPKKKFLSETTDIALDAKQFLTGPHFLNRLHNGQLPTWLRSYYIEFAIRNRMEIAGCSRPDKIKAMANLFLVLPELCIFRNQEDTEIPATQITGVFHYRTDGLPNTPTASLYEIDLQKYHLPNYIPMHYGYGDDGTPPTVYINPLNGLPF